MLEIVRKPADQRGFTVLPRRWVVERTFSWLLRWRRLVRESDTWIRRTVKNLAKTHIVIPAGFKREQGSGIGFATGIGTLTTTNAARCHAP